MRLILKYIMLAAVFCIHFPIFAATVWIDPAGDDISNDGTQLLPYRSLAKAQTVISPGDTINVNGGVYFENIIWQTFFDGVLIQGPRTGIPAVFSAPDTMAVLSIDGGEVPYDSTTIFQNLVFEHQPGVSGAGVSLRDAIPKFINCTFQNNKAAGNGGGVRVQRLFLPVNSMPQFIACSFISNTATNGGGLFVTNLAPKIVDCIFVGNGDINTNRGGGIYLQNCAGSFVQNNDLFGNMAGNGGGLFISDSISSIQYNSFFENNLFQGNTASGDGGGLHIQKSNVSTLFQSNTFAENRAGKSGGALFGSEITGSSFAANIIVGNQAQTSGGAIMMTTNSVADFRSNTITNNKTTLAGGGIAAQNGSVLNIGGAPSLQNNIYHNRTASGLNSVFAGNDVAALSHNYWGTTDTLRVAQQINIPNVGAVWQPFAVNAAAVYQKVLAQRFEYWFNDLHFSVQADSLQPLADSLIVVAYKDSVFTIPGTDAVLPKLIQFDRSMLGITNGQSLTLNYDDSELNAAGGVLPADLKIYYSDQGTPGTWVQYSSSVLVDSVNGIKADISGIDNAMKYWAMAVPANVADTLLNVFPEPNLNGVDPQSAISVLFQQPMDESRFTAGSILIRGSQSGLHTATFNFQAQQNALFIQPDVPFFYGEQVIVTLTDSLATAGGQALTGGFSWHFNIATKGGTASFQAGNSLQFAHGVTDVTSSDIDGDGDPDVLVVDQNNAKLYAYLNSGNQQFVAGDSITFPNQTQKLFCKDLDGDGLQEIVLVHNNGFDFSTYDPITETFGNLHSRNFIGSGFLNDIALSDLNNDGFIDYAVTRFANGSPKVTMYFADDTLGIDSTTPFSRFLPVSPSKLAVADLDYNGSMDVILNAGTTFNEITLYLNSGLNSFSNAVYTNIGMMADFLIAENLTGQPLGDVAPLELLSAGNIAQAKAGGIAIFGTQVTGGQLQLALQASLPFSGFLTSVTYSDINSDNRPDLLSGFDSQVIRLTINNGADFINGDSVSVGFTAPRTLTADFDSDGDPDLLVFGNQLNKGHLEFWWNATRQPGNWYVNNATPPPFLGTVLSPFHSINQALTAALDGDSIHVAGGGYSEQLRIDKQVSIVGDFTMPFMQLPALLPFDSVLVNVRPGNRVYLSDLALNSGTAQIGTGILAENGDSLLVLNRIFLNAFDTGLEARQSTVQMTKTIIDSNYAGVKAQNSDLTMSEVSIERNLFDGLSAQSSTIQMQDSRFELNASVGGYGMAQYNNSRSNLVTTSFRANGGANLFSDNSRLFMRYCTIDSAYGDGSAARNGSGVRVVNNDSLDISNSFFIMNTKNGMQIESGSGKINNVFVAFNDSLSTQNGAGIDVTTSPQLELFNNLVMANGTGLRISGTAPSIQYNNMFGNVQDISGATTDATNLFLPPHLVFNNPPFQSIGNIDSLDGFYQAKLAAGSPLIDMGSPALVDFDSSRSDIGAFGHIEIENITMPDRPQLQVVLEDSAVNLQWTPGQQTSPYRAIAVFRDTLDNFQPSPENLLIIKENPGTAYHDSLFTAGRTFNYKLAFIDSLGGVTGYSNQVSAFHPLRGIAVSRDSINAQVAMRDSLLTNIVIQNQGSLQETITISDPALPWLTLGTAQIDLAADSSFSLPLVLRGLDLTPDTTYAAQLSVQLVSNPAVQQTVEIAMHVVAIRDVAFEPDSLFFEVTMGQAADTIINLHNLGTLTENVSLNADPVSWLTLGIDQVELQPDSSARLNLHFDTGNLPYDQNYATRITSRLSSDTAITSSMPVVMRVAARRELKFTPDSIHVQIGLRDSLTIQAEIRNRGTLSESIRLNLPNVPWLRVSPQLFTLIPGQVQTLNLTFRAGLLPVNDGYSTSLEAQLVNTPAVTANLPLVMQVVERDITPPLTNFDFTPADTVRQSVLRFRFSGVDSINATLFTPAERLRYEYLLMRGAQAVERDTVSVTELTFFDLKDGNYKFVVAAIDEEGNGGLALTSNGTVATAQIIIDAARKTVYSREWQMVSVPKIVGQTGAELFGTKLISVKRYENEEYVSKRHNVINPGEAYWLFSADTLYKNFNQFNFVGGTSTYSINLKSGWNQIGNPWNWATRWVDTRFSGVSGDTLTLEQAIANGDINSGIYFYSPDTSVNYDFAFIDSSSLIVPWKGYWIFATRSQDMIFPRRIVETSLNVPDLTSNWLARPALDNNGYVVQLSAHRGKSVDAMNFAGVMPDSVQIPAYLNGALEPPLIGSGIRLYIADNGQKLNTSVGDFMQPGEVREYNIHVESNGLSGATTIRWTLPQNTALHSYLYDLAAGTWFDLVDRTSYTLAANVSSRRFKLFITDSDQFEPEILPTRFALYQNYPNPFNPQTTVSFDVPFFAENARVKLDVFDVLGRRVKQIINRSYEPGHYDVIWKGLDDNGYQIASGVYFYRLRVKDFTATKKMVVIR